MHTIKSIQVAQYLDNAGVFLSCINLQQVVSDQEGRKH